MRNDWYEMKECFVNPYNFVSLPGSPDRKPVENWRGPLTGKITCSIKLKTPLIIPDHEHMTSDENEHNTYPFLTMSGKPFIPGSEIRGAVRSVFEAATPSCLSILDHEQPLHGRNPNPTNKGGLICKRGTNWFLREATIISLDTFSTKNSREYSVDEHGYLCGINGKSTGYKTGDCVSFDTYTTSANDGHSRPVTRAKNIGSPSAKYRGYLLLGERGLTKDRVSSHILVPGEKEHRITDEAITALRALLECYRNDKINGLLGTDQHYGYPGYSIPKEDNVYYPVFYTTVTGTDGSIYYHLSPAMVTREVYHNTLTQVVGDFIPCSDFSDTRTVCPACGLFGTINKKASIGSAVSFSDASIVTDYPVTAGAWSHATLKELAGPKLTAMEFYTDFANRAKYGARVWNFDYYTIGEGSKPDKKTHDNEVRIRGRKFYLHHPNFQVDKACTDKKTPRNVTVDYLKEGRFVFDVCFNRVSAESLSMLLWCLNPVAEGRDLCYKLGYAKPLGFGSVKLRVDSLELRSFDADTGRYAIDQYAMDSLPDTYRVDAKALPQDLLYIMDFDLVPTIPIIYPIAKAGTGENADASHQWFAGNKACTGTGTNPRYYLLLPHITDTALSMPGLADKMVPGSKRIENKPQPSAQPNKSKQSVQHNNNRTYSNSRPGTVSSAKDTVIATVKEKYKLGCGYVVTLPKEYKAEGYIATDRPLVIGSTVKVVVGNQNPFKMLNCTLA